MATMTTIKPQRMKHGFTRTIAASDAVASPVPQSKIQIPKSKIFPATAQPRTLIPEPALAIIPTMSKDAFIFAGGGTGGHLFPGLAVAAAVRRQMSEARITFFTTMKPLDAELVMRSGFDQITQPVRPFSTNPLHWWGFWNAWRTSVKTATAHLKRIQPRAVLGLGGYAAGPAVVAAHKLGIRTAILNPDARPGRANRYLSRFVDLVAVQWDVASGLLAKPQACKALGCPIRAEFADASRAKGLEEFKLAADRPVLLVTGASQGATTVNDVMLRLWPEFHRHRPEWQLLHLTGKGADERVRAAYAAANAPAQVLSFTHAMPLALAAADVVVSRAGASTLAELTALGKASILLPYPYHRDRHQHANAQVLVDAGAAVLVEDLRNADQTYPALTAALERLADADTRTKMSAAAKNLGRPSAAADVANWLLDERASAESPSTISPTEQAA